MTSPEAPQERPEPNEDRIAADREAAYAEKPARDYIFEYREHLSPEATQALEWIASQEAEKAIRRYQETKDEGDPVVRTLRERALESIAFPPQLEEKIAAEKALSPAQQQRIENMPKLEWMARCKWALREVGSKVVEKELTLGGYPIEDAPKVLGRIGPDLAYGIELAHSGARSSTGFNERVLRGWFAGNLVANRGIGMLESIAAVRNEPLKKVVGDELDLLTAARISYPDLGPKLDSDFETHSLPFLWDKRQNRYIEIR